MHTTEDWHLVRREFRELCDARESELRWWADQTFGATLGGVALGRGGRSAVAPSANAAADLAASACFARHARNAVARGRGHRGDDPRGALRLRRGRRRRAVI